MTNHIPILNELHDDLVIQVRDMLVKFNIEGLELKILDVLLKNKDRNKLPVYCSIVRYIITYYWKERPRV